MQGSDDCKLRDDKGRVGFRPDSGFRTGEVGIEENPRRDVSLTNSATVKIDFDLKDLTVATKLLVVLVSLFPLIFLISAPLKTSSVYLKVIEDDSSRLNHV